MRDHTVEGLGRCEDTSRSECERRIAQAVGIYKLQHPEGFAPVEQRIKFLKRAYEQFGVSGDIPPGFSDYYVTAGMDKETLRVLYGSPTRIERRKNVLVWVYTYPHTINKYYIDDAGMVFKITRTRPSAPL